MSREINKFIMAIKLDPFDNRDSVQNVGFSISLGQRKLIVCLSTPRALRLKSDSALAMFCCVFIFILFLFYFWFVLKLYLFKDIYLICLPFFHALCFKLKITFYWPIYSPDACTIKSRQKWHKNRMSKWNGL